MRFNGVMLEDMDRVWIDSRQYSLKKLLNKASNTFRV